MSHDYEVIIVNYLVDLQSGPPLWGMILENPVAILFLTCTQQLAPQCDLNLAGTENQG